VQPPASDYGTKEAVFMYEKIGNFIMVPKGFYPILKTHDDSFTDEFDINDQKEFGKRNYEFTGELLDTETRDQKTVAKQAIMYLKAHRTVLLSLYCGFGKTISAIYLACVAKLKTCVIVHRTVLIDQWIESIEKFSTAKVQVLEGKTTIDPEADFCLINPLLAGKKNPEFFEEFGMLICDEVHVLCADVFSRAILRFTPKYLIGLSATPQRDDGMDKILDICFGTEARIKRIMQCHFNVYDLRTGLKPTFEYNVQGKINWNSLLDSLIENDIRNQTIAEIAQLYQDRTILILTKRVEHCRDLVDRLKKLDQSVTTMTGSSRKYDKTARILVSTFSKLGVGFDDKRLNMLILACDIVNVEQYAGRVFRTYEERPPVIIDLIDDHGTLKTHWYTRRQWYLSRGAEISSFKKIHPTFKIKNMN